MSTSWYGEFLRLRAIRPTCEHERKRLIRVDLSNGMRQFKLQCNDCALRFNSIPFAEVDRMVDAEGWTVEPPLPYDSDPIGRNDSYWDLYNEYLASPEWADKRQRVLRRAGGICESCLLSMATQAHHRSRVHEGDEPLFDLVAICKPCHERITAREREVRGLRR